MKKLVYLLLLHCPLWLQAQQYNVALIPDSLRNNANAVKRMEETRVVIKDLDKAIVINKYAITILNEAGDRYAGYSNSYDKLHSLSDVSGHLYDAGGKAIRSVKKKDISDVSYDDNMSLATDMRIKRHNFYCRQYPYTVEYEDEEEYNGIFMLPRWLPVDGEQIAVQQSRFIVETPADYALRYKQFNYNGAPQTGGNGKTKTYTWEVNNLMAVKSEIFAPAWQELTTAVVIAPTDFAIGQYRGRMDSWLNLGRFINTLNAGRDELPDNVKQTVHRLTDAVPDKKEKIRLLYQYLQQNTRYIGIQLGIGGWQPFDAKYVAANRYGDCKALSNYMKSLLKEAGIPANYVLITAGEGRRGLWEDFPVPYFNHVILCVPDAKDSVWLECTSQTQAAGFLGSFTNARQALLVADDGGHVVWTPDYAAGNNEQLRSVHAEIDAEGNLVADVRTSFSGLQEEGPHNLIHHASPEQREKYLNQTLNLPTYKVEKIDYQEQSQSIPVVNEFLRISSPGYGTVSGRRLFIEPNLFNKASRLPLAGQPRQFAIEYTASFRDVDSISITIPAGYQPESVPGNASISNVFGKYAIQFNVSGNQITVVRTYERLAGRYAAGSYPELVKFYADMAAADRKKMVFVKQ